MEILVLIFIIQNASPDVVKVLAANKCDASTHRAVDASTGNKIADNFDMPFFEVSCKENINIEEAFLTLARRIREQRGRRVSIDYTLIFTLSCIKDKKKVSFLSFLNFSFFFFSYSGKIKGESLRSFGERRSGCCYHCPVTVAAG